MTKLSQSKMDFLHGIVADPDSRHWGLKKLAERDDLLDFFPAMIELGLFEPETNPSPMADGEGFRVLYWEPLDYLQNAAKRASDKGDMNSITRVVDIIRNVTLYTPNDGKPIDNYHTWRSFAEIMAIVPTDAYSIADMEMVEAWIQSKYERGGFISPVISEKWVPKLLHSESSEDWVKALKILEYASKIKWTEPYPGADEKFEPATVVEQYWFKRLLENSARLFGQRCGEQSAKLMLDRVQQLFSKGDRKEHTWLWRPAIEDHPQNYGVQDTEDLLISGLRDILLAFIEKDTEGAALLVEHLLTKGSQIEKRIGLHSIDEHYALLKDIYTSHLSKQLFDVALLHEHYRLLKNHARKFTSDFQKKIISIISELEVPENGNEDEQEITQIIVRKNWLHALLNQHIEIAEELYAKLNSDPRVGSISEHPDFLSYMESSSGPGPSPYSVADLLSIDSNTLVTRLNQFQEIGGWKGPTVRALVETLKEAVKRDPLSFLAQLDTFLRLRVTYQYALVAAFRDLWVANDSMEGLLKKGDWNQAWEKLLRYCLAIVENEGFWTAEIEEARGLSNPNRNWIVSLISDFIRSGSQNDNHAFEDRLLPLARRIIEKILEHQISSAEGKEEDAMFEANNTPKGHCLQALFSYSLRICRLADKNESSHGEAWVTVQPIFDREIALCSEGNYEFSTLCGAYIANLIYLSSVWTINNLKKIFPRDAEYERNWNCAIQGFAYSSHFSKAIYRILKDASVYIDVLDRDIKGGHAKEHALQQIALGYLWGEDTWEEKGSLIHTVVYRFRADEIHNITRFFWGLHKQNLSGEQASKIIEFWRRCMENLPPEEDNKIKGLADLSLLTGYLKEISEETEEWLMKIAPAVPERYNTEQFLEYLDVLVERSPEPVGRIVLELLKHHQPYYDFENRFASIIRKLAAKSFRKLARDICDSKGLRDLPEIAALYSEIRN